MTRWMRPNARSRFPGETVEPLQCYPQGYEIAEVGPLPSPTTRSDA